jgi:hypothetical protein
MNDNFSLSEKFVPELVINEGGKTRRVPLENPMDRGYVYACMYFYDEVKKEVDKLDKMIRKIYDEVALMMGEDNPPVMLIEMSNRIRTAIGDDSLDALIKEILAEKAKHIALVPEPREVEKLNVVCESIFTELLAGFYSVTFAKAKDSAGYKTFSFTKDYVNEMTDRQKKLLAPALKMVGFLNQLKLNDFDLMSDWSVRYIPELLPEKFDEKEEEIKVSIKKLMEREIK